MEGREVGPVERPEKSPVEERRKLREIQKSAAFGRKGPIGVKAIFVAPPETPPKRRLRTHEALIIEQLEGFNPETLEPFVKQLQIA